MSRKRIAAANARIEAIRTEILEMDLVSSGSLQKRMMRCGKPNCRCENPDTRHGPYFEWGRMQGGRQVSTLVSEDEARALRSAIGNYRRIRTLLRRWERESVRIIKYTAALSADHEGR